MKNLSPTYHHFNILCIQPNTEVLTVENTWITCKVTWLHSPRVLSPQHVTEFRVAAAPGNIETGVKLAILMWILTLDNENNSQDLYVKIYRTVTFLHPQIFKTKIEPNLSLPYLKGMLKNPSIPMQLSQK